MKQLLFIAFLLSSSLTFGQDIFQKNLYSADRVLENREKLDLTDAQAAKIKKIHADNAGEFSTLKWDLDASTARLKSMLEESKIDPTLVNKQMDDVLRLESLLKKKQLNTLVAIKNELTSPQQKLLEIKGPLGLTGTTGYGNFNSAPLATSNIRVGTATTVSPNVSIRMDNGNPENTPLYIIDGQVIKDGELKNINPNDIESISVLKDKSATDTYGDKGKNGVIIITLKKNSKYYFQKK
jgi:TonB-dependent SusC/RagA subfamily outer membrane receptor